MGDCLFKWCSLIGLIFMVSSLSPVASETLGQKISEDNEISEFYTYLLSSKLANVTLQFKQLTIFAPINAAFQLKGNIKEDTDDLVLYHMTSVPKRTDQLGNSYTSLSSELSGNPPLWIAHIRGKYHDDIYVNNARILVSQSNIQGTGTDLTQVLHKIDEVLIPTISSKSASNRIYNPTAWEFLEKYESLIQHPHRVSIFRQKIEKYNKQDIFNTEGGHTFFIPVDEGFVKNRASLIDGKIIDGHVIPKQVLFTTPTKKDVPYQTLANDDNDIRVIIFFTQEQRQTTVINYVKSHTLFGDGKHTPGVVLAEIVKANIPVKNGVIHLIHKPLMVVDSTVRELLQEKDGSILSSFVDAINDMGKLGEDFLAKLGRRSDNYTLFAPCNQALQDDSTWNSIIRDKSRFMEILNMHLVVDNKIYVDRVVQNSRAPTVARGKYLYFNVIKQGNNRTLTVEGGGVNATVIQPDIAATNGIIHVIDRIFGVPYTTVYEKLRTDPILSDSFKLGNLQGFNDQLQDMTKKFTYFVPSNRAWLDAKVALPSAIKKLFMHEYAYHATTTLQRHLVISDTLYTMEAIKQQFGNETNAFGQRREVELPTVRGSLKLYVEDKADSFIIHWKGEKIPVFRPNVECTNGVIHVIDVPFIKEGDIQVSSASVFNIGPQILMILIAKFLL